LWEAINPSIRKAIFRKVCASAKICERGLIAASNTQFLSPNREAARSSARTSRVKGQSQAMITNAIVP
jgi:hypothetical protein